MFSSGVNYGKLKTNLRLVIHRLKLVGKKKTELALRARKEIADFLENGKVDRARIRVEHIIREDYLVEAMELVEMYCDLLIARFGIIQQMKILDEGIQEAVSTIIWAAPRLQSEIVEMQIIADQLTLKYGRPFAQAVLTENFPATSEALQSRLNVKAPPRHLVEQYLVEIAKSHKVAYDPDPELLNPPVPEHNVVGDLLDFNNQGYPPMPGGAAMMPCYPPPMPSAPQMSQGYPPAMYPGYPPDQGPSLPSYNTAINMPKVDFSTSTDKKEPIDHDKELDLLNKRFEELKKF